MGFRTRIVLASTVNVYGSANSEALLNEEAKLNPQTPYALSKWAQEELLRIYNARYPDLRFNIARIAQHTGSGRSSGMVETEIGEQILGIEQGLPPVIMVRNLLAEVALFDVRDACDAYLTLAATESSGGVYNVAPQKGSTVREIAEIMIEASQIATKRGVTFKSSGKEQFVPSRFDAAKIQELGWLPQIPLNHTLRDLLSWMRNGIHVPTHGVE